MTNLDREPKASGVEQTPSVRSKSIRFLESLLRPFITSAKTEGLTLFEIEFNKKETTMFPGGTVQETTFPVTIKPVEGMGKIHWEPCKYFLSGNRAAYYIEVRYITTRDGEETFLGITKTPPLDKVENKAEWVKAFVEGKIKPVLFKRLDDEIALFPSLSVTLFYGSMWVTREGGEDKLLEDFFQQLTEDIAI